MSTHATWLCTRWWRESIARPAYLEETAFKTVPSSASVTRTT